MYGRTSIYIYIYIRVYIKIYVTPASGVRYSAWVLRVLRDFCLGAPRRYPGATPLFVFCPSYITRGLIVVDRTRGACPVTCSSRHLTSHSYPFHSYISTAHFSHPQACVLFHSVRSRSVLATRQRSEDNERVILVAIRVG